MAKKDIKELTELEFEEFLLTVMVGVFVRTSVLENQGKDWKKVEKQLEVFLRFTEQLGHKNLIQYYNHARLPKDSLEKREEKIIDDFIEEEFWEALQLRLGQRDFFEETTDEELEELKKQFWLPEKVHEYYERYNDEFEKHGIERIKVVKEKVHKESIIKRNVN